MWLGKRKGVERKLTPPPGGYLWENAQGQLAGLPAYLRINSTVRPHVPLPGFDSEVSVVIEFNSAGDDGMPKTEEDLTSVDEIEDRIKFALEESLETIMAAVLTHGGCRRLTFYSANPRAAIATWERVLAPQMGTHRLQFEIRPDAQWKTYREFA